MAWRYAPLSQKFQLAHLTTSKKYGKSLVKVLMFSKDHVAFHNPCTTDIE